MFQIHLWGGLLLCIYCLLVGVSGSVLVFEDALGRLTYPHLMQPDTSGVSADPVKPLDTIADTIHREAPGWDITTLYTPGVRGSNYAGVLRRAGKYLYVFASATDGHVLGHQPLDQGWLNWTADLHFRLLAGSTGLIVNGVGAACLLVLCLTGAVIWWPGVRSWKRALAVDFRRRWKRINFDLHSAVGFWTLALLSIWAVSGVYFAWPQQFVSVVSLVSKAGNAAPPQFHLTDTMGPCLSVDSLVRTAQRIEPEGRVQGVIYADAGQPLTVMLARGELTDFSHTTYIYLDPRSGAKLGLWQVDKNRTVGDWFIWLLEPLHFGTYWGLGVKILWAILGLMLPLLAVTGVLMYWNRYLSKRWKSLRV